MPRPRLALLLALTVLPTLANAQVRLGPMFQVNSYTTGGQSSPQVATDAAGNFVVVWQSGQDGDGSGVFARWFEASGAPLTGDLRVNTYTAGSQRTPAVASTPDGRALVVWASDEQDGASSGVYARHYAAGAAAAGPEVRVNTYTTGSQIRPRVAADASGNFAVVWNSILPGSAHILGRRFDETGQPRGDEFAVSIATTQRHERPAVASDAAGNFVVAWSTEQDVFARRFDATGAAVGGEFQVNGPTTLRNVYPEVAMDAQGRYVVVWQRQELALSIEVPDVWGQRYDAAGAASGAAFRVNTNTELSQDDAAVALLADGRFVVAWSDRSGMGDTLARLYDGAGTADGGDFRLDTYTASGQGAPSVAADALENFVAVWQREDLVGQRFKPDFIFRDGFEDDTLDAWTANANDDGDLSVVPAAAMRSSAAGLRGVVDDTAGIYVQDDRPDGEERYRARFWFDPNGFDPGETQNRFRTRIFLGFSEAPTRRVLAIVLRRLGGQYGIRARARLDDNSQADTAFIPITDGPHAIELELRRAPSSGLPAGSLTLRIDGDIVASMMFLDNSLAEVDFVRMGALSVKPGANGTMYWDEFESRRQGAIGP